MENTQFEVEDLFGDIKSRASLLPKQLSKPNFFVANIM